MLPEKESPIGGIEPAVVAEPSQPPPGPEFLAGLKSSPEASLPAGPAMQGKRVTRLTFVKRLAKLPMEDIGAFDVSRDGRRVLVSGNSRGYVNGGVGTCLISTADGAVRQIANSRGAAIFTPDGRQIVLLRLYDDAKSKSNFSSDLVVLDANTLEVRWQELKAHAGIAGRCFAVSEDSRYLATAAEEVDPVFNVWDLVDRKLVWSKEKLGGVCTVFDRAGTNPLLLSPGWGLWSFSDAAKPAFVNLPLPFNGQPLSLLLDTRRKLIIAGCGENDITSLHAMDWPDMTTRAVLNVGEKHLHQLTLLPDGERVFTSAWSGEAAVWSLKTGEKLFSQQLTAEVKNSQLGKIPLRACLASDGQTVFTSATSQTGLTAATMGQDPWVDVWKLDFEQ